MRPNKLNATKVTQSCVDISTTKTYKWIPPRQCMPSRHPPVFRLTSRIIGSGIPSHIPVRSLGQVPKVAIKRSDDGQTFTKGHKRATTEFSEANGAVPRVHLPEPEFVSEPESMGAPSLRGLLPLRFLSRKSFLCFVFPGSDDVYRTRRHLSYGQLRFRHLKSFNWFLVSVLPLLLRILTLMLLHDSY
jgi:hypothetical protein